MKPQVVIVGRPNVGKSSLVNRLAGRRVAVVEEQRGVTRDRKTVEVEWCGVNFDIVDTGGWLQVGDELEDKVSQQADAALQEADLVILVVDVAVGVMDEDIAASRWVLRTGRPCILVANKVDDDRQESLVWEFLQLGLGEPFALSALHGRRSGDFLDLIVERLRLAEKEAVDVDPERLDDDSLNVAIVGRPNVGKSTLFNSLIGEERSVVHDMPGTTRDAIDTVIETPDGRVRFIDTAGMRRRAKTEAGLETYSVLRALDALDRADLALLVIDSTVGATGQDQRLAERIAAAGCPAIVILNKWEMIATEDRDVVLAGVADKLAFLGEAPVIKTTALSGKGVHKILPALHDAATDYVKRISTGTLNRAIRDLQIRQPSPTGRIRYAVQGATEPPTFTLFASGRLPQTYLRYVERMLREKFDLGSTPIRVRVRVD
ncbi:MAG: ribosome biogenesis GTPase Der [Actinomycetota bacterium]